MSSSNWALKQVDDVYENAIPQLHLSLLSPNSFPGFQGGGYFPTENISKGFIFLTIVWKRSDEFSFKLSAHFFFNLFYI